jgi:DNA-binding MarR family transcriptional regulator
MTAKRNNRAASPNAKLLTEIVLLVFRVNGRLLSAGDRLVGDLGLTSARWQMLGAVALSDSPRTAPQLAARMGMTRQAAQKQLDLLMEDGLVAPQSTLRLERVQTAWANRMAGSLAIRDLETTEQLLDNLSNRLTLP